MIERKHNPMWGMALAALVTIGLSACGGDGSAAGEGGMAEETAAAAPAAAPAQAGMEAAGAAPAAQEMPAGVTAEMIAKGKEIYGGAGICASCHGPNGQGIPNLGASLADGEWLHSDGSYEGITQTVMKGVTAQKSSTGVPMPAKGGTSITDEQVKAVSAYVWSLTKK